jgi:hypothetical protein
MFPTENGCLLSVTPPDPEKCASGAPLVCWRSVFRSSAIQHFNTFPIYLDAVSSRSTSAIFSIRRMQREPPHAGPPQLADNPAGCVEVVPLQYPLSVETTDEFLETSVRVGEENPPRTSGHVRPDRGAIETEWRRAYGRSRHGCQSERTRNPVASGRRRGRKTAAARPIRFPAKKAAGKRRIASAGETHREFSRLSVARASHSTHASNQEKNTSSGLNLHHS